MNQINAEHIIIKPIMTEKSLLGQSKGKYCFWVKKSASKFQIAKAFELVFSTKPLTVNTASIKGKVKMDMRKRKPFERSDRKKAMITVAKDQKIELLHYKTDKK